MKIHNSLTQLAIAALLLALVFNQDNDPRQCQIEPAEFEFSLNVISSVTVNGELTNGEDNILGAYINDECRGQAFPLDFQGTDLYFMIVYSNSNSGLVNFSFYDSQLDTPVQLDEQFDFQPNLILGTVLEPYNMNGLYLSLVGDLNSDAMLDVLDIIMLVAIILNLIESTEYQQIAGDTNGDSSLDVADIVIMVGWILSD
ncbi:MAG: hypothetical protein HOB17_04535 [Candidatus Marinimicrobia bacterium]|jgi:hypothetical protein|nr:hypothetical protein [Candidatus Neomarinimicrobiota bacterium]MBT3894435.1 hypothetical protein [Candidatus Neomarinimicrobiota bacterium]MBT4537293.1 hypothetical protein [Candidatus Neomarinimicrobiota bacterium]MBT4851201.1 hypothetical protein [Candidatus Neomarinimicrobiota bacterium]MBT5212532.1 hypothetical protein [Candidatus Neomarinimicrobiota bacterium]